MASPAHFGGGFQAEGGGGRVGDIVNAVTVDAGRNIRIAFADECCSVDTIFVSIINGAMAACASLWDLRAHCGDDFSSGLVIDALLVCGLWQSVQTAALVFPAARAFW